MVMLCSIYLLGSQLYNYWVSYSRIGNFSYYTYTPLKVSPRTISILQGLSPEPWYFIATLLILRYEIFSSYSKLDKDVFFFLNKCFLLIIKWDFVHTKVVVDWPWLIGPSYLSIYTAEKRPVNKRAMKSVWLCLIVSGPTKGGISSWCSKNPALKLSIVGI